MTVSRGGEHRGSCATDPGHIGAALGITARIGPRSIRAHHLLLLDFRRLRAELLILIFTALG
jgi:hypothetical protein